MSNWRTECGDPEHKPECRHLVTDTVLHSNGRIFPDPKHTHIVIMFWLADKGRGQEVFGPFATVTDRDEWVREVHAAGDAGDPELSGASFILTTLSEPFKVQR